MFSRPKILFLISLLFVALLNPKFNPYLPFKFLIFYHSSNINSKTISKVVNIKDLGIILSSNLNWDYHYKKSPAGHTNFLVSFAGLLQLTPY